MYLNFKIIKEILRKLLPPIIIDCIRIILRRENNIYRGYTYWGIYSDISECNIMFNIEEYVNENQNNSDLSKYKIKESTQLNIRDSIVPLLLCNLNTDNINILDIGGGYNSVYYFCKYFLKKNIKTTVVERKVIVDSIKEFIENEKNLKYIQDIKNTLPEDYNIINFGSSFQYFLNSTDILNEVFKHNALYIIITDTIFLDKKKSFITLQVNMFPSIFPYRFNNINDIIKIMSSNNYKLIYNSKRISEKHNILEPNEYYNRDLIFYNEENLSLKH